MSFAAITIFVASEQVFVVVYFIMTQSGNFWIHTRIIVFFLIFCSFCPLYGNWDSLVTMPELQAE
jgi:hypothetical protein